MNRPDPIEAARRLVIERLPEASQAWLAGSVISGTSTATSDLDITILRADGECRRESLLFEGWPVELFVHTEATIRHFVHQDLQRRRPSMARLVATGIPLLPGEGGQAIRRECAAVLRTGPEPMAAADLDARRYHLTDQLDDLRGADSSSPVADAIAVEVWRLTAEFILAATTWWTGGGKWMVRELAACDQARATDYAHRLHVALRDAFDGRVAPLVGIAEEALMMAGGPLWAGYRQSATISTS